MGDLWPYIVLLNVIRKNRLPARIDWQQFWTEKSPSPSWEQNAVACSATTAQTYLFFIDFFFQGYSMRRLFQGSSPPEDGVLDVPEGRVLGQLEHGWGDRHRSRPASFSHRRQEGLRWLWGQGWIVISNGLIVWASPAAYTKQAYSSIDAVSWVVVVGKIDKLKTTYIACSVQTSWVVLLVLSLRPLTPNNFLSVNFSVKYWG